MLQIAIDTRYFDPFEIPSLFTMMFSDRFILPSINITLLGNLVHIVQLDTKKINFSAKPLSFKEQILYHQILKKEQFDFLHVSHFNIPFLYPIPLIFSLDHLEYFQISSYWKFFWIRTIYAIVFQRSRKLIVSSKYISNFLSYEFSIPKHKIEIIQPYIPILSIQKDHHLFFQSPYILYVYRGKSKKNIKYLIELFVKIYSTVKDIFLVVIGNVYSNFVPTNVKIVLHVSAEMLYRFYSNAELFISPYALEGLTFSLKRALAHQLPIVCIINHSLTELIGEDGYLSFNDMEQNKFAKGVIQLLQKKSLAEEFRNSMKSKLHNLSYQKYVNQLQSVYTNIK